MCPRFLGRYFPVLECLEIINPKGRWVAKLVPGDDNPDSSVPPELYVQDLTVTKREQDAPAEWDLISLKQPIFHSSKFHSLIFAGPGKESIHFCRDALDMGWNMNNFLSTTGQGLRTLSLDWEDGSPHDAWYFEKRDCRDDLRKLQHLTCLTISLQALRKDLRDFKTWVDQLTEATSPAVELAKTFPASLKVLRINEFTASMYIAESMTDKLWVDSFVTAHNDTIHRFLVILRDHWLNGREDRELWFKRLDFLDEKHRVTFDASRATMNRLFARQEAGRAFAPVARRAWTEGDGEEGEH